jgi:hypothetical protein
MVEGARGESLSFVRVEGGRRKNTTRTIQGIAVRPTVRFIQRHHRMKSNLPKNQSEESATALTIGHSTRTIEEFLQLLQTHGVQCVVDVRTVPRSQHNPQFNRDTLPTSLRAAGVDYLHMPDLGGLRRPTLHSLNPGWKNASFRGYADYMQTSKFEKSLRALIELAKHKRIAIMCAEAVPWRCHRSLIADALTVRGIHAEHIMSLKNRQIHSLTPFAKVDGARITYPLEDSGATLGPRASS